MTAKYVWNSVFVFAVAVAIFCVFLCCFCHLLLARAIFNSKDITFVLMSIPVTFSRLCKRIPEAMSNECKCERERETEKERSFPHRFRYLDLSIDSGFVLVRKRTCFVSCRRRYIFGQISWLDQIKRKLKASKKKTDDERMGKKRNSDCR